MILLSQIKDFLKVKFYLSSWAYTFPIASMSIATILMYHGTKIENYKYLAYLFAGLLVLIVGILFIRTIKAIKDREICIYEEH
jgi:tellurite resistance protein